MRNPSNADWTTVCELDDVVPDTGVRALVGDAQVAIFRISQWDQMFAIDAIDPFSNAPVLSGGIVGDVKGQLVVASPIYKQHFSLHTGECLEDEAVAVRTFDARVVDGHVQIRRFSSAGKPLAQLSSCEGQPLAQLSSCEGQPLAQLSSCEGQPLALPG